MDPRFLANLPFPVPDILEFTSRVLPGIFPKVFSPTVLGKQACQSFPYQLVRLSGYHPVVPVMDVSDIVAQCSATPASVVATPPLKTVTSLNKESRLLEFHVPKR